MDDVDAIQAQIARNMLTSGDWVTARLDGVPYLEKAPLIYWVIAIFFKLFGLHDWAARIPIALSVMALAWLTAAFGNWAFGRRAGLYAGLCVASCIADRSFRYGARLAHRGFWQLGFREAHRAVCRPVRWELHRTLSIHTHIDSRRDADFHDCLGDVGISARA